MKIAFIHYHLNTGGVTSVIRRQAQAVCQRGEALILSGRPPSSILPFDVVHIPGLGYDGETAPWPAPAQVAGAICDAIHAKWPRGCDIIHVHNATLTKNRNILGILKELQHRGLRLFIQIHDFAEDGRPSVYCSEQYVADCHYGVINSRDYHLLLKAGLKKAGLHFMPNPCRTPSASNNQKNGQTYALYPVRAIRRKNPGEALLTSLFLKDGETLALTQPPDEPSEMRCYNDWKRFATLRNLRVAFEVGQNQQYDALWARSEFILTTSISEGFGLFFVDAWSAGKLLWGRYLPQVCTDFEKNGLALGHLYRELKVPVEWIDLRSFQRQWIACLKAVFQRFGRQVNEPLLTRLSRRSIPNGHIDFGLLDERRQRQIIARCQTDAASKNRLLRLNPFLYQPGYVLEKNKLVAHNQKAARDKYHPNQYARELLKRYAIIRSLPVRHRIDKARLLDSFLRTDRFSLLKWARYEG